MTVHVVHKDVMGQLINELSEKVYALGEAWKAEVARNELATKRTQNDNRKKLTKYEVSAIRRLFHDKGWSQAEIADAYDINPATVSRIVRGIYHAKESARG